MKKDKIVLFAMLLIGFAGLLLIGYYGSPAVALGVYLFSVFNNYEQNKRFVSKMNIKKQGL